MFKATIPLNMRRMLPRGYISLFFWVCDEFCIPFGERDVVHWILCQDKARSTVHLSYLPAQTEDMGALLPVELLSRQERHQYLT
jgi:hypothetical protein